MASSLSKASSLSISGLLILAALAALWWIQGGRPASVAGPVEPPTGVRAAPSADLEAPAVLAREAPAEEERLAPGRTETEPVAAETPATRGARPPFHGQVVDVATGEPVPLLKMVAGPLEAAVDEQGRFAAAEPLPNGTGSIEFHDPITGTHVRTVRRDELEPDGDGWIARIAIGPTYRLRITGAGPRPVEAWRGRLVEVLADGRVGRGAWIPLHPGDPPFLRYDNPWEPDWRDSTFLVEVRDLDGAVSGTSAPLSGAVGIYPTVVDVPIDRALAAVRGRVVDRAGAGKNQARVVLVPLAAGGFGEEADEWPEERTNGEGEFAFEALTPGAYRVLVRPRRGETPQTRTVELPPGETTLADFVFAIHQSAGRIEGRLESRSGKPFDRRQIVRLRAVDGRAFELLDVSSVGGRATRPIRRGLDLSELESPSTHLFEFNEVPAGEYELSVVSQEGFAWSPARVLVEPPGDEIVFVREDDVRTVEYSFRVLDDVTGEELRGFLLQIQIGETWDPDPDPEIVRDESVELPAGMPFRWSLHAPGYRAAFGDREDLVIDPRTRTATVRLVPGWSARLHLRDLGNGIQADDPDGRLAAAEAAPVAGAEVRADGERAGTSDAEGVVEIVLDTEPELVEITAPGWRVVGSEHFRRGRLVFYSREVVVWMARE